MASGSMKSLTIIGSLFSVVTILLLCMIGWIFVQHQDVKMSQDVIYFVLSATVLFITSLFISLLILWMSFKGQKNDRVAGY